MLISFCYVFLSVFNVFCGFSCVSTFFVFSFHFAKACEWPKKRSALVPGHVELWQVSAAISGTTKTNLFYFRIRSYQFVFNPWIHDVKFEHVPGLCNQLLPSLLKQIFLQFSHDTWYQHFSSATLSCCSLFSHSNPLQKIRHQHTADHKGRSGAPTNRWSAIDFSSENTFEFDSWVILLMHQLKVASH